MKKGFTVLEMILVLSVISLIFLITLPNIQQKNKVIHTKGCEALTSVVDSQILLYEVENLVTPGSISDLIEKGYLKEGREPLPKRFYDRNRQWSGKCTKNSGYTLIEMIFVLTMLIVMTGMTIRHIPDSSYSSF